MDLFTFKKPIIIADLNEASFVAYGIQELHAVIDAQHPILSNWNEDAVLDSDCLILIGRSIVNQSSFTVPAVPGPEGFSIQSFEWNRIKVFTVVGSDPQGTKYGVIELIKSIRNDNDELQIPFPLNHLDKPYHSIRVMFAHLHWQYNYPYACRSWSLEDWKHYVDLLTYFGANVMKVWTMLCMLPIPLSKEDEEYLKMFNALAEYARTCRGMEFWVSECPNNVAKSDQAVPISAREYFGNEKLLNPGDPNDFAELMASRENLYRIINKASGFSIIDSDPGFWKGSPSSEFVRILAENEKLIERYNQTDNPRMLYWMQWSWGNGSREENWRDTLQGLQNELKHPWNILMGTYPDHYTVVEQMGLLDKVVYLPYGVVEPEPSVPMTQLHFEEIRNKIQYGLDKGFTKAMGQAQTAIVQLPNIYFFMRCLWNPDYRLEDSHQVLKDLAHLLYPSCADTVADNWYHLGTESSSEGSQALERLQHEIQMGTHKKSSTVNRLLFGNPGIVAEDLAVQATIRSEGLFFKEKVSSGCSVDEIKAHFYHAVSAILQWRDRHNYLPMGGAKYLYGPNLNVLIEGIRSYEKQYGDLSFLFDVEWPVKSSLYQERTFHPGFVDGVLTEIRSQVRVG